MSAYYVPGIVVGTRYTMVNNTDMVLGSLASGRYRQVNRELQCNVISAVIGKSPGVTRTQNQQPRCGKSWKLLGRKFV